MKALWCVLAMSTSGCVAHVVLPLVPTKAAPEAEREAAFKEMTPIADPLPDATFWGANPGVPKFILLNNGLRVEDPTDC